MNKKITSLDFSLLPKMLFSRTQRLKFESFILNKKEKTLNDFFTEDFGDEQFINRKLAVIQKNFPEAKLEIKYVPVVDNDGVKFSERKAFNLVIER